MEKAKVYFTKDLTSKGLIKAYDSIGFKLKGNICVKLHSGEDGNQNFLRPEYVKDLVQYVNGRVVECNTAYKGKRTNTKDHLELLEKHGWSKYFDVDIMDSESDIILDIPNGNVIKKNYVGEHIKNYDSMLVLSHFKGHPMGGFGGALKQLSIGCASRRGKAYIHSAGNLLDANILWDNLPKQDLFIESMADASSSVHNLFKDNIVYINVLKNISVDCDCVHEAEDPCIKDIGILVSTDPIAIDKASLDLIEKSNDPGLDHFMERVNTRNGKHIFDAALKLNFGTDNYELIDID